MIKLKNKQSKHGKFVKEHSQSIENCDSMPLIFSFKNLQSNYCVSKCTTNEKAAFSDQLRILGSKTWRELKQAPKHGIGFEKINYFKVAIPKSLENETFIAFRFDGKKPMVGYRCKQIFNIVYLDRNFTLYDHG